MTNFGVLDLLRLGWANALDQLARSFWSGFLLSGVSFSLM
jgi:hypothetical protein